MNDHKYDVVFWAYNSMVADRAIPLMVRLNKEGYKTLLFYQDYGIRDNMAPALEFLLKRYALDILTYSDFLRKDVLLRLITSGIRIVRNVYLSNKLRGLRNKILAKKIDKKFINGIIHRVSPRLNMYDTINLMEYNEYPIGSYHIKRFSDENGIPGIAMPHGLRTHYKKNIEIQKFVDFKKVIIASEEEREYMESICTDNVEEILSIGDPRYDSTWKSELRTVFRGKGGSIRSVAGSRNVLYLLPSMEQYGMDDEVYKALGHMASMAVSLGDIKLFIRPHPRHRHKDKISKVMKENGLKHFEVIGNDPLIAYAEKIDYVISPVTSALFDFIPEMDEKVVIYYEFIKKEEFINIFRGYVNFFEDIETLTAYLRSEHKLPLVEKEEMKRFCDKWVANGEGLDSIVERYVELIKGELRNGDIK